MFKKILVPSDLSAKSKEPLSIAVDLAAHSQGEVDLVHVIELIPNTFFEEFEDFYTKLEQHAEKELALLIAPYQNQRVRINREIVYGNRVEEILRFAKSRDIDLIVMNSHKIDFDNPTQGWGTISYKVVALSQCPTMLVK